MRTPHHDNDDGCVLSSRFDFPDCPASAMRNFVGSVVGVTLLVVCAKGFVLPGVVKARSDAYFFVNGRLL